MDIRPFIIEVHVIIEATKWASAYDRIADALKNADTKKYSLVPLYATYDLEDTELRLCLNFENPQKLDAFIVEVIRPIPGVYATRVRLTLNGKIFKDGVAKLIKSDQNLLKSSHIFIKTEPGKDKAVWDSLSKLKEEGGVFPTWIFRDFYEYERDITLRLVGENDKVIRAYIDKNVNSIDGIQVWNFKFMHSKIQFVPDAKLLEFAKSWFN